LTHLSLFSGIGGIDLAAHWAGFRTVAFVERDKYCQKVLAKHWPEVPIYDDVTTFDGRPFRGVDLISGGFPCQPHSLTGNRRGAEDDRYLWPEVVRIVSESRPTWCCFENVIGLVTLGLDQCLFDLGGAGYQARPVVFPACAVGGDFRGQRVFIIAEAVQERIQGGGKAKVLGQPGVPGDKDGGGLAPLRRRPDIRGPRLCRSRNGVPAYVDRIGALGNAVVPQQVYPILKAIADQIRSNEAALIHGGK
jgi:DNA (cytosine-5)-methyltransferase 1